MTGTGARPGDGARGRLRGEMGVRGRRPGQESRSTDPHRKDTFFAYDRLNRLSRFDTEPVTATWRHHYDALGRRIAKTDGTTTYYYFFDGEQAVVELVDDGATVKVKEYIHGLGIDEVLLESLPDPGAGGSARTFWPLIDSLGTVRDLADQDGASLARLRMAYDYDPDGKVTETVAAGTAIYQDVLVTGRRLDRESGLYYYRARYYDPEIGRFLQRDPIGIWGDGVGLGNGYVYVGNDPVNWVDPSGNLTIGGLDLATELVRQALEEGGYKNPEGFGVGGFSGGGGAGGEASGGWISGVLDVMDIPRNIIMWIFVRTGRKIGGCPHEYEFDDPFCECIPPEGMIEVEIYVFGIELAIGGLGKAAKEGVERLAREGLEESVEEAVEEGAEPLAREGVEAGGKKADDVASGEVQASRSRSPY